MISDRIQSAFNFAGWAAAARVGAILAVAASLADPALAQQQGDRPPPAVVTEQVQVQEINPPQDYVGRLEAVRVADLVARAAGFLEEVHFDEGGDVEAGDLLYTIDDAEYRAALQLADANVARANASLREADLAFERTSELFERGTVSEATRDEARAVRDTAAASLQAVEAERVQAELNLSYTTIKAPIAGRIGATRFTRGDFIDLQSGALSRIIQMDPMRAVFSISEVVLVEAKLETAGLSQDELNARFTPRIILPDGTEYDEAGRIDFISNEVDATTGTIAVRAAFPNPSGILLQGQFVEIRVTETESETRPVVPIGAVQRDRDGQFVFGLNDENVVERIAITTGERLPTVLAVLDGLDGGERIIVEGLQKARVGQPVAPEERTAEASE